MIEPGALTCNSELRGKIPSHSGWGQKVEKLGATGQKIVRFGLFEADLTNRILTKGGLRLRLQDQPFQVLVMLLERPGEVVRREELQQRLWASDTYVAFDDGLNTAIKKLRNALSDTSDNPRFVETVPRRGYRFVAPVSVVDPGVRPESEAPSAPLAEDIVIAARERTRVMIEPATSRRTGTAVLLSAAAALLLIAAYVFHASKPALQTRETGTPSAPVAALKIRPSVAVIGFRNLSHGSDANWISTAMAEMLNTELAAGESLRMIPGERVSHAKTDRAVAESEALGKETLAGLRSSLGADYVVLGSYIAMGQADKRKIRLDIRLQDTREGETIAEESFTGKEEDLFELASDAGSRLRQRFQLAALNSEEATRVRASLPASVEAARLYAEGLTKLRTFEARDARDLLSKAAAADPRNAIIHSALSAAWSRLGYDAKAKDEAKLSLDLADSLSREDRLVVQGRYEQTARDWPAAIEAFRTLWTSFPDNLEYGLLLASAEISSGQGKDAMATVEAMRKLVRNGIVDPRIDLAEDSAAEVLGDFKRTQSAAEAAAKAGEAQHSEVIVAAARSDEAWAWDRLGEFDKALEALRLSEAAFSAAGDRGSSAMAEAMRGEILNSRGKYQEARRAYDKTIATCREIGNLRCVGRTTNALGNLLRDHGDLAAAKTCYEEVLSINRETGNPAGIAAALGNLANLQDDLGEVIQESEMQKQALDMAQQIGDKRGIGTTMTNLANALVAQGELKQAAKLVDQAVAIDREIGFKRGLSFALHSRADILEEQDQLDEARRTQSESLELRKALGGPELIEMSLAQEASLALDQDRPAEAQSAAEQAIKQIENQKEYDLEASAYALLARSLLAQGKGGAAKQAADQSVSAASKVANYSSRVDAQLALAAVNTSLGNSNAAHTALDKVIAESSKKGYALVRLRAELALGKLEVRASRVDDARRRFSELEREAKAKGFHLIARQAAAAAR